MWELLKQYDIALFSFVNLSLQNRFFDVVMPVISNPHFYILPIVVVLVMIVRHYSKKGYILVLLTICAIVSSEAVSSSFLKPLISRTRPCNERGAIHLYVHDQWQQTPANEIRFYKSRTSFSFPSAHASNTFTLATLWTLFLGGYSWLLYILAITVSFSRIYLGVHYPLDVTGGAFIGVYLGFFWYVFYYDILSRIRLFAFDTIDRKNEQ